MIVQHKIRRELKTFYIVGKLSPLMVIKGLLGVSSLPHLPSSSLVKVPCEVLPVRKLDVNSS